MNFEKFFPPKKEEEGIAAFAEKESNALERFTGKAESLAKAFMLMTALTIGANVAHAENTKSAKLSPETGEKAERIRTRYKVQQFFKDSSERTEDAVVEYEGQDIENELTRQQISIEADGIEVKKMSNGDGSPAKITLYAIGDLRTVSCVISKEGMGEEVELTVKCMNTDRSSEAFTFVNGKLIRTMKIEAPETQVIQ
jgi:hypothetical protein